MASMPNTCCRQGHCRTPPAAPCYLPQTGGAVWVQLCHRQEGRASNRGGGVGDSCAKHVFYFGECLTVLAVGGGPSMVQVHA